MTHLTFAYPDNVIFALSIPLYLFIWLISEYSSRHVLSKIASARMLGQLILAPHPAHKIIRITMVTFILLLATLLLMRPRWGTYTIETIERNVDIVFTVDISSSMLARDIYPSRLEKAKLEMVHLIEKLQGERVGIVLFAGTAFGYVPLTHDYKTLLNFIDNIKSDMISYEGTQLASAIKTSLDILRRAPPLNKKIIILLSDGENHAEPKQPILRHLNNSTIQIHVIGLGEEQGDLIPLGTLSAQNPDTTYSPSPKPKSLTRKSPFHVQALLDDNIPTHDNIPTQRYLKDAKGNAITTRLNKSILRDISFLTGGTLIIPTSYELAGTALYKRIAALGGQIQKNQTIRIQGERFRYPAFILLILIICEFLITRLPNQK